MKMTSSVNNLIFLFLLAFSVFIIYRYVISLEKELSLLKSEVLTLKALKSPIDATSNIVDSARFDDVCVTASGVIESITDGPLDAADDHQDEDMESVTSKDIMRIVDEINDEDREEPVVIESEEVDLTEPVDDDIVITKSSEDDLSKKTNEELKKILKEQGKNTKGTKSDLIKRIVEEA
jgi:hypothetical protein